MTTSSHRHARHHRLFAAAGVAGLAAASLVAVPAAGAAPTGPEPASFTPTEYVVDGIVVAVRRAPAPDGAYGAHGVDYAPQTQP